MTKARLLPKKKSLFLKSPLRFRLLARPGLRYQDASLFYVQPVAFAHFHVVAQWLTTPALWYL